MPKTEIVLIFSLIVVLNASIIKLDPLLPPTGCTDDSECPQGRFCLNSECADWCLLAKCIKGNICWEGVCHPVCTKTSQCPEGFICNGQFCVDKCEYLDCDDPSLCSKGQCDSTPFKCETEECPGGFYCSNGYCEDLCLRNNPCSENQNCVFGECYPFTY